MKRREFLKKLGLAGALAPIVAPKLVSFDRQEEEAEQPQNNPRVVVSYPGRYSYSATYYYGNDPTYSQHCSNCGYMNTVSANTTCWQCGKLL